MGLAVWGFFATRAARFRLTQPRPEGHGRLRVVGSDPIRVLVTGAGLAAGYGVRRHEESFAARLSDVMAESTGRGVIVDIRSAPLLPAASVVAHLGEVGTHSYDLAVFAPCYLETSSSPGRGMSRHGDSIQQHLLNTGSRQLRVVMLGLPRPSHYSRLDLAAVKAVTTTNRAMKRRAATSSQVHYVDPPDFGSVRDEHPFSAAYYSDLGDGIAAQISPALEGRRPSAS